MSSDILPKVCSSVLREADVSQLVGLVVITLSIDLQSLLEISSESLLFSPDVSILNIFRKEGEGKDYTRNILRCALGGITPGISTCI